MFVLTIFANGAGWEPVAAYGPFNEYHHAYKYIEVIKERYDRSFGSHWSSSVIQLQPVNN